MELASLYADARARVTALARRLTDDELERPVPACPGWTVRDVLAHLTGVAADVPAGRADPTAADAWTARHVADRRQRSLDEVLDEWNRQAPALEALLLDGGRGGIFRVVIDVATHEQDLRAALGRPGGADSPAFDFALQCFVQALHGRLERAGGPALVLRAGVQEWTVGPGEPRAAVTAPTELELFRAVSGRRSAAQLRRLAWEGDPEPVLDAFSPFGPLPVHDLEE